MNDGTKKRDILFVIGSLGLGGSERHLATIAPLLVRRGWAVSIYSLAGSGPVRAALERGGVSVIVPPFERDQGSRAPLARVGRIVAAAAHLFTLLLRRRPAIVHFFLPAAYLVGAPLAVICAIRCRVMSRRSLNLYQRRYMGLSGLERVLHRSMTAILANSRSVWRDLHEAEHVPQARLGLIYNGIDTSAYDAARSPSAPCVSDTSSGVFTMGIVANLIPYKGHADLLDALALANPDLPRGWRLKVVGRDDGLGEALRRQAQALAIDRNVLFLGQRDDVAAILKGCDVGIICSHEEGFSNAVLEGMAAGLAMIVTDVGGNPEAVADGECGLVVRPRDPAGLAQAIRTLASNPALRARLGEAARRRIAETFALTTCIDQYDATYRALLASGTLPAAVRVRTKNQDK